MKFLLESPSPLVRDSKLETPTHTFHEKEGISFIIFGWFMNQQYSKFIIRISRIHLDKQLSVNMASTFSVKRKVPLEDTRPLKIRRNVR
jgi:hypothetical protein